jgi:hypothetical protein
VERVFPVTSGNQPEAADSTTPNWRGDCSHTEQPFSKMAKGPVRARFASHNPPVPSLDFWRSGHATRFLRRAQSSCRHLDVVQGPADSVSVHPPVFSEWLAGGMVANGRWLGAEDQEARMTAIWRLPSRGFHIRAARPFPGQRRGGSCALLVVFVSLKLAVTRIWL